MPGNLPKEIEKVVHDLRRDEGAREIWLIGSQASGCATPQSDWDLLIIADREPIVRSHRESSVDVLWCGPSGRVLLEGQPESLEFKFSDFHWNEYENGRAKYRGRKFTDASASIIRDAAEPIQKFVEAAAVRLWARQHEQK